jgi:hypothetical protein
MLWLWRLLVLRYLLPRVVRAVASRRGPWAAAMALVLVRRVLFARRRLF